MAAAKVPQNYDWKGVIFDSGLTTIDGEQCIPDDKHLYGDNVTYYKNSAGKDFVRVKMDSPVEKGTVTTHSAEAAYEKVLSYCGASLYRDNVDARYMEEAANGTTTYIGSATKTGDGKTVVHRAGIIDYVKDQGEYVLETGSREAGFDSDNDGMADAWETANGLNPNDASDAKTYTLDSKGWYTNLEVYCNALVEDIMQAGNADATESVDEYYPACVKPEATGIQSAIQSQVRHIEYFTADGRQLQQPQTGISIRRLTMANGKTITNKVMK